MTALLILIFGMFGVYGWQLAVTAGVSLLRLLPASTFTRHGLRLFAPRWEFSQFILLAAIFSLRYGFGQGLHDAARHHVMQLAVPAVGIVLVRIGLLLVLSYKKLPTGVSPLNLLYSACSFAVPLAFGASAIYALLGQDFWQSGLGWQLLVALAAVTLAAAVTFVYYTVGRTPHDRLHQVSRWLNVLAAALTFVALLTLQHVQLHRLARSSFTLALSLTLLIIGLQALFWLLARERMLWGYLSGYLVLMPVCLVLANRPFLLYPTKLLQDAYRQPSSGSAITVAVALGVITILVARLLRPLSQTAPKP